MDNKQSKKRELIITGSVRTSKSSGSKYVMSKTFSIDEAIRNVSQYVSFVVFTDKKDPEKRTIYISESDKRFVPKDDAYTQDGAYFVNARVQQSKSGVSYTRSSTVNLEDVRRHLGSDYAFIMITKPKKEGNEEQRTLIIKTSSAKFMPGAKSKNIQGGGYRGRSGDTTQSSEEDDIVI